ncbi:MAG: cofactor-independent phosphoglycerate mutase [Syntrophales bacterium]
MKYIVLLGDGMADYPVDELGGKTPLEAARTANMDFMAKEGTLGLVDTIPKGFKPGSDVANLTVLGYDPGTCYSGRGPLEAANMGIVLGPNDVAFRCNLITLGEGDDPIMDDFTAGHITSAEALAIINDLNRELGNEVYRFFPGVSYRHLLVWRNGEETMNTTPPHDITGQRTNGFVPCGKGDREILSLMKKAREVLEVHPANRDRLSKGKKPANAIWLWGQGRAPRMDKLTDRYQITGGIISAVDLLNGIGIYAGLRPIHVEGATGYTDTNYAGKAQQALAALHDLDFVFLHVEAPDEMGHEGNLNGKIKAIEDFDEKVVGTVLRGINKLGDVRVMVLSDHPTPLVMRTHAADPSPFAFYSSLPAENRRSGFSYGETMAKASGLIVSPGYDLMDIFIAKGMPFIEKGL